MKCFKKYYVIFKLRWYADYYSDLAREVPSYSEYSIHCYYATKRAIKRIKQL
jgi:hypothetical protein